MVLNSSFTLIELFIEFLIEMLYIDLPPLPLWSSLSELSGVCVISLVLSHHNKDLKQLTSVTRSHSSEFYLVNKGDYTLEACCCSCC